ncbi:MAG: DUF977 family protein [bacterium]|nr:DUF977 family protein [bacterium]
MNYFVLIIVGVAGVALGMYLARRNTGGFISESLGARDGQSEKKAENKQKILEFIRTNGKTRNNDVEKLVGVSNATAERYLNELEKEGAITQHGTIGQNVFYTLK